MEQPEILRASEIAARLGMSYKAFWAMQQRGGFPKPDFRFGTNNRTMAWSPKTVAGWLASKSVQSND